MKWLFIPLILLCLGCSSHIHPLADRTTFKLDYHRYISNDSLSLYFKSPADIDYPEGHLRLKKALRKSELNAEKDILLYGISEFPPYEYVLTVSPTISSITSDKYVIFDTIMNGQSVRFIGNPLVVDAKRILTADLEDMVRSVSSSPLEVE